MTAVQLGNIHAWRKMQSASRTISVIAALLCGFTACLKWSNTEVSSKQPDRALFEAAMSAMEQDRFDVASLTLQTLVNTYPDSEYASKAKLVLQDP
jgi:outer membrane protein assembly factor BamD (BamD/ComL family)